MKFQLFGKKGQIMIKFENVSKIYDLKDRKVIALQDVNLEIGDGTIFGVIGYSGAGKSTLVRCINLLEKPSSGKIYLNDIELTGLNDKELRVQRRKMGMIFQQFNLLNQRTVLKNVMYALEIAGIKKQAAANKARDLLRVVGLENRADAYPAQLSGGQKQRVAIARALASDPEVLLCDEATSALDPNTTDQILELLQEINRKMGVTIVVITHEMNIVEKICHEVAVIDEGRIVESGKVKDVFVNPQSKMAKKLIIPNHQLLGNFVNHNILRLVFEGNSASEPVIANLATKVKVSVSILEAKTQTIDGKAFGQMVIQMPDDKTEQEKIKKYLDKIDIKYVEGNGNDN